VLLFTMLCCSVDTCDYYVVVVNGHMLSCMCSFILYSVVGILVLSLLLLFFISVVVSDFTVSWFLVGFQFCCSYNDVFPGCIVGSEHLMMVERPKHVV
jgi:hypothetical protein